VHLENRMGLPSRTFRVFSSWRNLAIKPFLSSSTTNRVVWTWGQQSSDITHLEVVVVGDMAGRWWPLKAKT